MASLTPFVRAFVPESPTTAFTGNDDEGRLIHVAHVGMRQGPPDHASREASASSTQRMQAQFEQEARERDSDPRRQKSYMEMAANRAGRRTNAEVRAPLADNTGKILRSLERPEPVRFHHHQDVRLTEAATSGARRLATSAVRPVATFALPKQPQHAPAMRAAGRFGV